VKSTLWHPPSSLSPDLMGTYPTSGHPNPRYRPQDRFVRRSRKFFKEFNVGSGICRVGFREIGFRIQPKAIRTVGSSILCELVVNVLISKSCIQSHPNYTQSQLLSRQSPYKGGFPAVVTRQSKLV
jgi:hypothetical protein